MNAIVISFSNLLRYPHSVAVGGRDIHPIKWRAKYGGLEVSDARRLRSLGAENGKLKELLAEAMLDNAILKDVAAKKW
jgi:putative transposase